MRDWTGRTRGGRAARGKAGSKAAQTVATTQGQREGEEESAPAQRLPNAKQYAKQDLQEVGTAALDNAEAATARSNRRKSDGLPARSRAARIPASEAANNEVTQTKQNRNATHLCLGLPLIPLLLCRHLLPLRLLRLHVHIPCALGGLLQLVLRRLERLFRDGELVGEGLDVVLALEERLLELLDVRFGGFGARGGGVDFVAELDEALSGVLARRSAMDAESEKDSRRARGDVIELAIGATDAGLETEANAPPLSYQSSSSMLSFNNRA
ncbi:hypothetical protein MSAN_02061500 [Mycena sanguinolenta]|uniref:Uncharacterized protein n=1 Tax=Mycena sanguinolenta TaxID=230812 RepID=A0A8H7CND1_9AGAR|nr:hypothetical protein MSAN_02061500 [Mycena sanguinolenta]